MSFLDRTYFLVSRKGLDGAVATYESTNLSSDATACAVGFFYTILVAVAVFLRDKRLSEPFNCLLVLIGSVFSSKRLTVKLSRPLVRCIMVWVSYEGLF